MGQRIFVISDLHMAAKNCGFFSAQDALSKFIAHVAATPGEVDLVILGDALDYLQIEPYLDFTARVAGDKTGAIIEGNQPVFAALRAFVEQAGKRLRWVIGNHDLELLFPAARELIEHAILGRTAGPGCPLSWHLDGGHLDYVAANHAIVRLVHGNQGDGWNAVDYEAAEAAVQSGTASNAIYPPGSRLVAEVLNPLYAQGFRHVHMLKPETTVALPLSIAFWPDETRKLIRAAFPLFAVKTRDDIKRWLLEKLGLVRKETFGAPEVAPDGDAVVELLLAELHAAIAISGEPLNTALAGDLAGWLTQDGSGSLLAHYLDEPEPEEATYEAPGWAKNSISALLHGAARIANGRANPWMLDEEDDLAGPAARTIASEHVSVLIAGHTHLARTVSYRGGYYLNTGTWADLMKIPRAIPGQEFKDYARGLRNYLADLESCPFELRSFRRLTYVEIDLGDAAGPHPYRVRLREWPTEGPKTLQQYP
jgi:UDP-2,3-diacylglucosamine pyrophosphatase LpxH